MLTNCLFLTLLLGMVAADCGGGRGPTHVYQEQTEILEDGELLHREKTIFQVTKSKESTTVEEESDNGTIFEDKENENVTDKNVKEEQEKVTDQGSADNGSKDYDEDGNKIDEWTKKHSKKIKGLTLLQNVTQVLRLPQSGELICWANVCHEMDVVLHRVEVEAPPGVILQCLDGGVGSFKMVFKVKGRAGVRGQMIAKMWGAYNTGDRYIWVTSGDWEYQCAERITHC